MSSHDSDRAVYLVGLGSLLGLLLAAPPVEARIEILRTGISATATYQFGGSPQGPFQTMETTESFQPAQTGAGITRAEARLDVPAFTPPSGAPGDTRFLPAAIHAFQSIDGFNSTAVDASAAQGLLFNSFTASTLWEIDILVTNALGLPSDLELDYLLFPGEVGVSAFGTDRRAAFVHTQIDISQPSDIVPRVLSASSLFLSRESNSLIPSLSTSGDFSEAQIALTSDTRNGLNFDMATSDAIVKSVNLGNFASGTELKLRYEMSASVLIPGFEVAGFARIGDPFDLSSDPEAFLQTQFPGLDIASFSVRETPAPVPLPAAWMLLASGLASVGWRHRVRGSAKPSIPA